MSAHHPCALVVLGVALCAPLPGAARADDIRSLDEAAFLAELKTRSPRVAAAEARVKAADAAIAEHGVRPNPALAYEREHVPGLDSHDDRLRVGWTVDFSDRRDAAIDAARLDARATAADADRAAFELELEARRRYADAALARQRVAALTAARTPLAELVALLAERAAAGDAAGYDADRVALELDLLDDELRSAQRALDRARHALGAMLGDPDAPIDAADDVVLPAAPIGAATEPRPDVVAARHRADAARADARGARSWFPALELGIGVQWSAAGDDDGLGYIVTIGGALPVRDRGDARARRADALAIAWDAEADALAIEARGAAAVAVDDLVAATEQARTFADGPAKRAAALTASARVAYVEGDRSIVELLDALRTERTAAARALELLGEARAAELALELANGRTP